VVKRVRRSGLPEFCPHNRAHMQHAGKRPGAGRGRSVAALAASLALRLSAGAGDGVELLPYATPVVDGLHWAETFDGDVWARWTACSDTEKYDGRWRVDKRNEEALLGDLGLHCPDPAKHYCASADIPPVQLREGGPPLFVQFEVRHQDGLQCGGSYMKLSARNGTDSSKFDGDAPYVIMFGPDKCGATNKVHFILRHQNRRTGEWEEKHLKDAPAVPSNKRTHLYGFMVQSDNYFELQIDGDTKVSGSLLDIFEPPINPPRDIDDPTDTKPADWVDVQYIADASAKKPADWGDEDEPEGIPDPTAQKPDGWLEGEPLKIPDARATRPDDWDDAEDGPWEPMLVDNPACSVGCGAWQHPMIENPRFVGRWEAPLIDNPEYKGEWAPRQIENPSYAFDGHPALLPTIDAIGFDLWTMQGGLLFDNIIVVLGNASLARDVADRSWSLRRGIEEVQDPPEPEDLPGGQGLSGWIDRNPVCGAVISWAILIALSFHFLCPGVPIWLWRRLKRRSHQDGGPAEDEHKKQT